MSYVKSPKPIRHWPFPDLTDLSGLVDVLAISRSQLRMRIHTARVTQFSKRNSVVFPYEKYTHN